MQIFHALGPIKRSLGGGVANALEHRLGRNRRLRAQQFSEHPSLIKTAFPLAGWMQRHRHNDVESVPAQSFIIQRSLEPARYKMSDRKSVVEGKSVDLGGR